MLYTARGGPHARSPVLLLASPREHRKTDRVTGDPRRGQRLVGPTEAHREGGHASLHAKRVDRGEGEA